MGLLNELKAQVRRTAERRSASLEGEGEADQSPNALSIKQFPPNAHYADADRLSDLRWRA
ncbi:MAG TPA: hypothetical protein VN682_07165 [Terriglobales bacterium]|nr:hypothetical protein [Terriglobales bacterium]